MVAIETHYLGPTNTKGSRYVASATAGNRVVIPCDYSLNQNENHAKAAKTLREKLNWGRNGPMLGGHTMHGMAWIFVEDAETI